jgi:NADH-quinone oxidoreductase subunit M
MLIIGLGFFPQPVLTAINPAVDAVVSHLGKTDPTPKTATPISAPADQEGGHE